MAPALFCVSTEASPGILPLQLLQEGLFRWLFPCPLPPGCLPAFSLGAGQHPQGSRPAQPIDLSDSRLEAPLAEKTQKNSPPLFPRK